jgi:hypothetical protein
MSGLKAAAPGSLGRETYPVANELWPARGNRKQMRMASGVKPDVGFRHLISSRTLRAAIIAAVVINDAALAADYELLSAVIVSSNHSVPQTHEFTG